MSTSKILFEKGRRMMSESDLEIEVDADDDVWDDRKLNDAYDKALKIASAEVAKRVAMTTNTRPDARDDHKKPRKEKLSKPSASKMPKKEEWKPGMGCRALYEEDGLEYEAFVLRIINEKECVVRFLGYDNCEIVPINTLKESLGKKERQKQIEQATVKTDDQTNNMEWKEVESDRVPSPGSTELSFQRKKKSPKKKKNQKPTNVFEMPEMPFQMPNFSMMPNLGSLDLPMPPPPPMALPDQVDSEDQAVSSMLLSWYMSGYYTGLYQGMKRAQQGRKRL
ncbi:survival motor neuron [Choristoneura fumiferana]|uniref:survival motor neuron n=1 Tax=Choristoneura fumiferana TaxID=7141 RepID=UPI003D15A754